MLSLDKTDLSAQQTSNTIIDSSEVKNPIPWPDPTPEELNSLWFNQIWNVIKTWDVNVPEVYDGYCGATGNHVVAILHALNPPKQGE
jgi:hypothetical protein